MMSKKAACPSSNDSDQPAQMHRAINVIALHSVGSQISKLSLHGRQWFRLEHYENTPIQIMYIENFMIIKGKFSDKMFYIFHISAQNRNCWYSSEPPRRGGSNEHPQSMFFGKVRKII